MHQDPTVRPCACTQLRKASRAVSRVYDEALSASGISTAQFAIRRHVARSEPVALSRLAEQLVMDRTSLYRALTPLETKAWVAVAPGPGKSRLASLTADGRAVMRGAEGDWHAVQARLAAAMAPGQWAALQSALHTVIDFAKHGGW